MNEFQEDSIKLMKKLSRLRNEFNRNIKKIQYLNPDSEKSL